MPLSPTEKAKLEACRPLLLDCLRVQNILGYLYQEEVISDHEMESLQAIQTNRDAVERLLEMLRDDTREDEYIFDRLCDALYYCGQKWLAEKLKFPDTPTTESEDDLK